MRIGEILAAVLIHLVVPGAGLAWYLVLCRRLLHQGASAAFLGQLFVIFFCWGGLLLVTLTALFWKWSGMASVGTAFLIFIAPLLLGAIVFRLSQIKQPSPVQRSALHACLSYYGAFFLLIVAALLFSA